MILTRTPFRISFVGGGSDHFNKNTNIPGRVISTTINKYIYVSVNQRYDDKVRLSYSLTENVNKTSQLNHLIIRNTLEYFKIKNSIEIVTLADIPSSGSGLGSSSALTVGLTKALYGFKNRIISKKKLGEISSFIEIERCNKPIGMQDHYSAAYGGFNSIIFKNNKRVIVNKIKISKNNLIKFKNNLIMFYSGINRKADKILEKIKNQKDQNKHYEKISKLTQNFEKELNYGNIDNLGEIMNENWMLKRNLHKSVTSTKLDEIYKNAIDTGALGGKLLGAGGGGYFLFLVKSNNREKLKKRLSKFKCINFDFSEEGSAIKFFD